MCREAQMGNLRVDHLLDLVREGENRGAPQNIVSSEIVHLNHTSENCLENSIELKLYYIFKFVLF